MSGTGIEPARLCGIGVSPVAITLCASVSHILFLTKSAILSCDKIWVCRVPKNRKTSSRPISSVNEKRISTLFLIHYGMKY